MSDDRPSIPLLPVIVPSGQLPATTDQSTGRFGLVGASQGMREVYRKIELYAASDASVIVTGETGTGKELVARALHSQGPRRAAPFVAVNCSAIAAELLESELFGHEKGSFTGAQRTHRGRFERAHGGTIFLDEVGDMPLPAQAKLLRVLEEGMVERVGAERPVAVDVRVVGATNVPLERAVHEGRFRADLYHRLAVLRIALPPLRQRPEDIPLLVDHFLRYFRRKYARSVERLTPEAMALLDAYLWPGNVRELRNVLERVFVENQAEVIGARAFREWVLERQDFTPGEWGPEPPLPGEVVTPPWPLPGAPLEPTVVRRRRSTKPANLDAAIIHRAWRSADGNLTTAARLLGVHRATLYRSLERLGLSRDELDRR
jgi:DNA-binding NtrC family response regulator